MCVIKSPREYRLLKQLLIKPTSRLKLNGIVRAINTPQVVKDLRDRSNLKIPCIRKWVTDGDGVRTNPGTYHLTEQDNVVAKEAVKKWENGAATPSPILDK